MFIVLIGSFCRKESHKNSDVDICRINNFKKVKRHNEWKTSPISYIDYTLEDFEKLYFNGSLFIYHILKEGILLEGDKEKWEFYVQNFKFIDNYLEEAINLKNILINILDIKMYGQTYLTFYSNLFRILKNFSIFLLAHNNDFEFNKKRAFEKIFGDKYYELLNSAYNQVERGIYDKQNSIVYADKIKTQNLINYILIKLKELNI